MTEDRKRARAAALLAKFRTVVGERLERLENAFVAIEANPSDKEAANVLVREIHTLKGEAKLMGLDEANRVAHRTEDVIFRLRDEGWRPSEDVAQTILAGFDLIRALMGGGDQPAPVAGAVEAYGGRVSALLEQAPAATTPANRPTVALSTPVTDKTETQTIRVTPARGVQAADLDGKQGTGGDAPAPRGRPRGAGATIRVDVEKLDSFADRIADIARAQQRVEQTLSKVREIGRAWRQVHRQVERERSLGAGAEAAMERALERLETLNGEMLDALLLDQEGAFVREHGLRELEDAIKGLRLVPLSSLFERFPRAVRDLAKELGKEVRFEVVGGEHTVDNRILDQLADPLVHLTRNAVDHGIESPAARHAAGKIDVGVVRLSAHQTGSSVEITVSDDGRGIDLDAVRAAAVERGIVDEATAAALEDHEVMRLVFEPGFTTRRQTTDLSGRGVGLDVVRERIEAVGGSVGLDGAPGVGTVVTLRVPVSVALMPALVVRVGDLHLAVPSHAVAAVVDVERDQLRTVGNETALWLGDRHVALEHLPTLLGLGAETTDEDVLRVLVVEDQGRELGLVGMEILAERQLTLKPLDPFLRDLHLVVGTTILDSGEPALVVSVAELVRRGRASVGRELSVAQRRRVKVTRTVLLVEDSEVIRDMLERIVSGEGHRVLEAANGRDALAIAKAEPPDLVLTDLEMPVMDGFELIEQVRAEPSLAGVPIVVLSSRGSFEDRRRAGELGADAYLVKTDFREELLCETLDRFLAIERVRRS